MDHEQAVAAASARLGKARAEHVEAQEAYRGAVDAWAASLTEIRPGDTVERIKEFGVPVERRGRRGKPATLWRVDGISGRLWGHCEVPQIKLLCTYIGKDGQPGKRTAEIPAGDVRPASVGEDRAQR